MMDEESTIRENLAKQARVEARQFARLFATADGKAVLDVLKRDYGWDAASPPPNKDGEIPMSHLRAWTGSRSVIALILHKISTGRSLGESKTTHANHDDERED